MFIHKICLVTDTCSKELVTLLLIIRKASLNQWYSAVKERKNDIYLFSFSLIYGLTGTTNFTELSYYCLDDNFAGSNLVKVGLIFLVAAFLFKVAAFPFHMWSPDVYEGAPTSTTVFFAVVPKLALIGVFLRLLNISFIKFEEVWWLLISISGIISVIIGGFVAFKQENLKRLLAYSGIGHVGFILLAMSTKSVTGIQVSLFYAVVYMLTSVLIWSVFMSTLSPGKNELSYSISHWGGLFSSNPGLSILLSLGFFSLAGIPPLVGFSAKAFVFLAALTASNYVVAMVGVLASVVSAAYYTSIIKTIYFEKSKNCSISSKGLKSFVKTG